MAAGPGRTVELFWYEQRALDLGELISVMILLKAAEIVTDELLREGVRTGVAAIREARGRHRTQGMIRLPGEDPVEYWLGENVPDEALDGIEADSANAEPGSSRYWQDGRWTSRDG
jgi:hypothetical protein